MSARRQMSRHYQRNVAILAFALITILPRTAASVPDVMARDQMLEIANEHLRLSWTCNNYNIYTSAQIPKAHCPYSSPGLQSGMAYNWGGYDTRDSFWTNVVVNHGFAGNDTSAAGVLSNTYGNDCSGYASRCWRSGHYTTSSFPGISNQVSYTTIAPGDLMDLSGSHCRIFEKYTGTNLHQEFECTAGVTPSRVTRRILSTDSSYVPYRYKYVVAWPSLVRATAASASSALIEFLGAATTGFRVYRSIDAVNWTQIANESTLGVLANSYTATGLANATTYYFKVTALNGTMETAASGVLPLRIASGARKALLVQGYDRWTRKTESGGLPNTFLTRDAQSLAIAGYAFDSVDNLRVVDLTVPLTNYSSVWWMLGDESRTDECFSYQEQLRVQDYLTAGGKLFVSGSEIAYDVIGGAGPINDTAFATNYLKLGTTYTDGASGQGYTFSGVTGTAFAGATGGFDNGTGGTFNVSTPDTLAPATGAKAILTYSAGGNAGIQYTGTFGTGTTPGSLVVLGFPIETITNASARQTIINSASNTFFGGAAVENWNLYQAGVLGN